MGSVNKEKTRSRYCGGSDIKRLPVGMSLLALTLLSASPSTSEGLDSTKILKMVIIHDLAECARSIRCCTMPN
jgi:hypothetical protein